MSKICGEGWVSDLFGHKITEIFDFLFWDDEDSVIIFECGKDIIKMNPMAKEFFLNYEIDDFTKKMDKFSKEIWNDFLLDTTISSLATCQITLTDPHKCNMIFDIEGCYNHSTFQYIIRFKQVQEKVTISSKSLDVLRMYESSFKYAPHGLVLTTIDGTIIEANRMVETLFDLSADELIGKNSNLIYQLLPDSQYDFSQFFKEVLSKGSAKMISSKGDSNGEVKFYQFNSIYNKAINMYVTVIRDETEKIQLKKQVEHNGSLSTLGQLAASIAHEIRNPMTSLKGFTQLLTHQVTKEGNQYLEIITSELNRMESILNEFLVLSKPSERSFRFISLSSLITQVVEFMYPQGIIQNIELEFVSWDKESDSVLGDAYELKKVFMNIFKNAIEVMPNGGKVTITQTLIDDKQVRVSVTDQGVGMTSDQMHKIFLPFYTSKEFGTGLGLAHAVQTIEDHGGSIEVESELSQGTTFHLILPIYHLDAMKEKTIHDQSHTKPYREVIPSN
jgi:two-component system, sporulation sensor kinase E